MTNPEGVAFQADLISVLGNIFGGAMIVMPEG